jgi:hypothetical protein
MTAYEEAELAGRIEVILRTMLDAARKHEWKAFDRLMEKLGVLRTSIDANQSGDTD